MSKLHFSKDLIDFLGLDTSKSYSLKTIENKINGLEIKPNKINIYFPGFQTCLCGTCSVDKDNFIMFIKLNCILDNIKPDYYYFEYNQLPEKINKIEFKA
jgi:hypothetical protein